ncbi:response regulator transcription factor [Verrucosispora sp. WMMD573]|uniref:response regulator n=1 Tax=Verrucosispora sp. WMMD573 TaxID=3015149 RepID=UPI00248C2F83|nr:response regulator transcription factor [Verrucosispora sp. WMMD573]WBB53374.1 response regulator transcription factor [Verrucosispora sp. WMMD573]
MTAIMVVAEAADGRQALTLARVHLPDIALVDIQMPVMDGIETTRQLAADPALVGVHVVILTNYGLDEHVFHALRAGAAGFLVKDIEPADLVHAVRADTWRPGEQPLTVGATGAPRSPGPAGAAARPAAPARQR